MSTLIIYLVQTCLCRYGDSVGDNSIAFMATLRHSDYSCIDLRAWCYRETNLSSVSSSSTSLRIILKQVNYIMIQIKLSRIITPGNAYWTIKI